MITPASSWPAVSSESIPAGPLFSHDGSQLIIGQGRDSALVEVSVYDIALGQFRLRSTYHGHDAEVAAAAFLPDGTAVSAGGDQNAIHFWNPAHFEGEQTGIIKGVGRVVHAVGINADEQIGIGNYDDLRSANGEIILQRVFSLHNMTLGAVSIREAAAFRRAERRAGERWLEWGSYEAAGQLCLQPGNQSLTNAASAGGARHDIWFHRQGDYQSPAPVTGASRLLVAGQMATIGRWNDSWSGTPRRFAITLQVESGWLLRVRIRSFACGTWKMSSRIAAWIYTPP